MPLVSLIIPAYNAEKYLRRCLNSAMEQTFRDMEIIVINDGSTDTTLQICREYEQMDERFHVIDKANTCLLYTSISRRTPLWSAGSSR